jgi:hypothetical protein
MLHHTAGHRKAGSHKHIHSTHSSTTTTAAAGSYRSFVAAAAPIAGSSCSMWFGILFAHVVAAAQELFKTQLGNI